MEKFTSFLKVCLLVCGSTLTSYSANIYSIANGNWSSILTWSYTSGGLTCLCTPAPGDNIFIQSNVTLDVNLTGGSGITGTLTIAAGKSLYTQSNNLTIKSGGTLTVNGNLDVNNLDLQNGSTVLIASGAKVETWGSFNNSNNSDQVTLNGALIMHSTCYNGNGGVIQGSGVAAFSSVCTGSGTWNVPLSPLPIEFISFSAERINGTMELKWATASENNNDYFTVERSLNALDFTLVTIVKGTGNSNSEVQYSAIDLNPAKEISYYRLKQTDLDGKSSYSPIIIGKPADEHQGISVYPNPSTADNINVQLTGEKNEEILVVVQDFLGREYYSKIVLLETGAYKFVIDPSKTLSPGVYMVTASGHNNKLYSQKIIVQ